MDQGSDIQMEMEQPAPKITAPAKPSARPRGTALMDGQGWCGIDPENIVTGGKRNRRSAGGTMHAEETEETEDSMCFCKPFQQMINKVAITAAMTAAVAGIHRTKGGKDEEDDIQISIPADSNNSKPAPTLEVPGIKENESENFVIT